MARFQHSSSLKPTANSTLVRFISMCSIGMLWFMRYRIVDFFGDRHPSCVVTALGSEVIGAPSGTYGPDGVTGRAQQWRAMKS
jgi:hypothetical protein